MNEEQLRHMETTLGVTLPENYRAVLKAYPFQPTGNDWVYWMYGDPQRVIAASLDPLRGYYTGSSWLPSYLALGEGACGDQYFLDLRRSPSPVYCLCHETHEITPDYPNLETYVAEWSAAARRRTPRISRFWKWWPT